MSIQDFYPNIYQCIFQNLDDASIWAFSEATKAEKMVRECLQAKELYEELIQLPSFISFYNKMNRLMPLAIFTPSFQEMVQIDQTKKLKQPKQLSAPQLHFLEQCFLCDTIKSYDHQIPQDIKTLVESKKLLSLDNFNKLKDYIKARDTLIVWKKIANAATLSVFFSFEIWEDTQKFCDTAQGYAQWCQDNKNSLENVFKLDLSDNKLTEVPDLTCLTNLQNLDLALNKLTEAPDLTCFTYLQSLDLAVNKLTEAPDLSKNPGLKELNLSKNILSKAPDLSQNPGLKKLNLSNNKLTEAPDLSQNPELKELNLSNNKLTKAPDLSQNPELRTLGLSDNELTTVFAMSHLKMLWTLNLSHNKLTTAPNPSICPPNLLNLNLSDNELTVVPTYTKLSTLNLSHNKLTELPDLSKCRLVELDLSNNPCTRWSLLSRYKHLTMPASILLVGLGMIYFDLDQTLLWGGIGVIQSIAHNILGF